MIVEPTDHLDYQRNATLQTAHPWRERRVHHPRDLQLYSKFLRRSSRIDEKPPKLWNGAPPAAFRYVGRDRDCRTHQLIRSFVGTRTPDGLGESDGLRRNF
jgi:hypothetical protein